MFSEICCVGGFGDPPTGQLYRNANGPLDIVPANGWFLGALPLVTEPPTADVVIARNGGIANIGDEGWTLEMFDDSVAAGEPAVGFRFTVFDGAGVAATVETAGVGYLRNLDIIGGAIAFPLMLGFAPVSATFPNGAISISGIASGNPAVPLAAPYVNNSPALRLGSNGALAGAPFALPNCISGIVGGEAAWSEGSGPFLSELDAVRLDWVDAIVTASQVVEVPATSLPGLVNQNGWRIEAGATPFSVAPDPLEDFVDSEPLEYENPDPDATLSIGCSAPFTIYPENIQFPY